jgi:hypothetical protein
MIAKGLSFGTLAFRVAEVVADAIEAERVTRDLKRNGYNETSSWLETVKEVRVLVRLVANGSAPVFCRHYAVKCKFAEVLERRGSFRKWQDYDAAVAETRAKREAEEIRQRNLSLVGGAA